MGAATDKFCLLLLFSIVPFNVATGDHTHCISDGSELSCNKMVVYDNVADLEKMIVSKLSHNITSLNLRDNNIMVLNVGSLLNGSANQINKLSLSKNKFRSIPEGYERIEYLDVECNQLKEITKDSFVGYASLKELNLNYNKISTLTSNAFKGANNLSKLFLSANAIKTLNNDTFKGLFSLKHLDLSFNEIDDVTNNLFKDLKSLRKLSIIKNDLQSIKRSHFKHIRKLKSFDASYNKINFIEQGAFKGLRDSVRSINLRNNKLIKIEKNIFNRLKDLKELRLVRNKISTIASLAFEGLYVNLLDLSNNNIHLLHRNMLAGLTVLNRLDLSNNPIICDCDLHFDFVHYPIAQKMVGNCSRSLQNMPIRDVIVDNALNCHPCLRNPCKNNGECVIRDDGYWCNCTEQFTGNHCEVLKHPCDSVKCFNGGTCRENGLTDYNCICTSGYNGEHCQNEIVGDSSGAAKLDKCNFLLLMLSFVVYYIIK